MKRLLPLAFVAACGPAGGGDSRIEYAGCIHSHNDYDHERPLLDALDAGACSVEVDVFVQGSALLVAHDAAELDPARTIRTLYLDPLAGVAATNGGIVRDGGLLLLVDVKSDAAATWPVLESTLAEYPELFSRWDLGIKTDGPVTAIVSGNRDRAALEAANTRFSAMDGRLADLGSGAPASLMPLISDSWLLNFTWFGEDEMPPDQRALLEGYVSDAHDEGRLIRFYSAPEDIDLWREQVRAGVDLLGGDDLLELRALLDGETVRP